MSSTERYYANLSGEDHNVHEDWPLIKGSVLLSRDDDPVHVHAIKAGPAGISNILTSRAKPLRSSGLNVVKATYRQHLRDGVTPNPEMYYPDGSTIRYLSPLEGLFPNKVVTGRLVELTMQLVAPDVFKEYGLSIPRVDSRPRGGEVLHDRSAYALMQGVLVSGGRESVVGSAMTLTPRIMRAQSRNHPYGLTLHTELEYDTNDADLFGAPSVAYENRSEKDAYYDVKTAVTRIPDKRSAAFGEWLASQRNAINVREQNARNPFGGMHE